MGKSISAPSPHDSGCQTGRNSKNYKRFENLFSRSAILEQAQPASFIRLEMAAIQSEHPDFEMFENSANQLLRSYNSFKFSMWPTLAAHRPSQAA